MLTGSLSCRLSASDKDAQAGQAIVGLLEGKERGSVAYPEEGMEVYCLPAGQLSSAVLRAVSAAAPRPGPSLPAAVGPGQLLLLVVYKKVGICADALHTSSCDCALTSHPSQACKTATKADRKKITSER